MSFQSYEPNLTNLQSYLDNEQSRGTSSTNDGPTWWSLPSGMSSIRILPPWDPTGRIAMEVYMHAIEYKGKDMKYTKYNWTCTNKTSNKPCKICEGLQKLSEAGVDVSKYEPNRRQFYMNALVMHDPRYQASLNAGKKPEEAEGVAPGTQVLLRAPKTLYDWVISQITNPMVGDITSLTTGIDVYVTKSGEGLGTTYTPTLSPNGRAPVPKEYLDKIESLYNLEEIFSKGFDDGLIDELVAHLTKSAGAIAGNIPNVVNQMAGYQIAPQVQAPTAPAYVSPMYPSSQSVHTGIPTIPQSPVLGNLGSNSVPQSPMSKPTPPHTVPATDAVPQTVSQENVPKCFGQYNPSQVNCVVCSHEIQCSQNSNKS